jgi:hypothetical protein
LKASHRAGQAMVATGFAIVLAFAAQTHSDNLGVLVLFGVPGLCLALVGWIVARRASARIARFPREGPTPAP